MDTINERNGGKGGSDSVRRQVEGGTRGGVGVRGYDIGIWDPTDFVPYKLLEAPLAS